MKKILLAFIIALGMFTNLKAGHELGGVIITYKSVGHITGDSLDYLLRVYTVYDNQGAPSPANANLSVSSSCYSNSNYSLPKYSSTAFTLPGSDYCTGTNVAQFSQLVVYQDTISVQGICQDFEFFYNSGFGRFNSSTNIQNSFSTNYFFTLLNNRWGPNSSPQIKVQDIVQAACINKNIQLYGFSESDNDSLYYSPSTPQVGSASSQSNLTFETNYSRLNPVNTTGVYTLNTANGSLQTSLTSIGNFSITIRYKEYRRDTLGQQQLIGESRFSFGLTGTNTCQPEVLQMTALNNLNADSLDCGIKEFDLKFNRYLAPASVALNGSDINLISAPLNLAVVAARVVDDSILRIRFNNYLEPGQSFSIATKTGTDGNSIISRCGTAYLDSDTVRIDIRNNPNVLSNVFTHQVNGLNLNLALAQTNADSIVLSMGDGSILYNQTSVNYNYPNSGNYLIQIWQYSYCGDSAYTSLNLAFCDSLISNYTFSLSTDTLKLDARASSGYSQIIWDFGDGNTANGDSLNHIYSTNGNFTVELQLINICGDTLRNSFSVLIEKCVLPWASWNFNIVSSGAQGLNVDFDASASTNATKYIWDFGDGSPLDSSGAQLSHNYVTASLNYRVTLRVKNDCGESNSYSYRLDQIGIDENGVANVSIYPNPTTDIIRFQGVDYKDIDQVRIYQLDGKLIKNYQLNSDNMIDVQVLQPQVYILEFMIEGKQTKIKFLKQ